MAFLECWAPPVIFPSTVGSCKIALNIVNRAAIVTAVFHVTVVQQFVLCVWHPTTVQHLNSKMKSNGLLGVLGPSRDLLLLHRWIL